MDFEGGLGKASENIRRYMSGLRFSLKLFDHSFVHLHHPIRFYVIVLVH